ncbi:MAG: SOS response-associated peptidase [Sphingobacteriales bacterium]|nr:MAG: SOS response-associated peptidase [Sphingobacteriales bacterium]
MCYYNGSRVSRAEYIRLMGIEKELRNLRLNRPAQNGFDYRDWPIIKPLAGGKDFEIKEVHWEYIPSFIHDEHELKEARKMYTWLNAKSENLFVNDKGRPSMFREGALHGRCLFLSSGFYEWRHVPKIGKKGQLLKATEKIPYYITTKRNDEYFFMAGISRVWENVSRGQSADTAAIVTTKANEMMEVIHNAKKRMPTILPESLAIEWLQGNISQRQIEGLGSYQFPVEQMEAWPVSKEFLKLDEPEKEFDYPELPAATW